MRKSTFPLCVLAFALLFAGAAVQAAPITGTVTNKTTNKPSAGDTVVLVDVQAGMSEAASATTNSAGKYSITAPGMGPYLIRVNHQGGTYFIAAPQAEQPGDVTVYDVSAKVDGVSIDADMFLIEAAAGTLRVHERVLIKNTSLPPKAQFSDKTFEIVLPAEAELDGASATRPGGMATNTRPVPLSQKGHYTINIPIQPNKGEKETMFEVQYHLAYNGSYTLSPRPQMPADNLVVYAAKGLQFKPAQGASFQATQEDPRVQTFVTKNVHPGQAISFTISGEGQMPAQSPGPGMAPQAGMGDSGSADTGNKPGGGIGVPINSPDPLTQYKWWILGTLTLLLVVAAVYFLRKKSDGTSASSQPATPQQAQDLSYEPRPVQAAARPQAVSSSAPPANSTSALLSALKEELFAIESARLSGTLSAAEYAEVKAGLEAVLKRTLSQK